MCILEERGRVKRVKGWEATSEEQGGQRMKKRVGFGNGGGSENGAWL